MKELIAKAAVLSMILAAGALVSLAHEGERGHVAQRPLAGPDAVAPVGELPAPPEGVTHLAFGDFFKKPVGRRGLEYSDLLASLAGKRVRVLGYMVGTDRPAPGLAMLAPFPIELHESEYGMADDLPPSALHVIVPAIATGIVPFKPGPLLVTGTLELGAKPMPDGRTSPFRLVLDAGDLTFGAQPSADTDAHDHEHGHDHNGHAHGSH